MSFHADVMAFHGDLKGPKHGGFKMVIDGDFHGNLTEEFMMIQRKFLSDFHDSLDRDFPVIPRNYLSIWTWT